jgi:hypothetical protein
MPLLHLDLVEGVLPVTCSSGTKVGPLVSLDLQTNPVPDFPGTTIALKAATALNPSLADSIGKSDRFCAPSHVDGFPRRFDAPLQGMDNPKQFTAMEKERRDRS